MAYSRCCLFSVLLTSPLLPATGNVAADTKQQEHTAVLSRTVTTGSSAGNSMLLTYLLCCKHLGTHTSLHLLIDTGQFVCEKSSYRTHI